MNVKNNFNLSIADLKKIRDKISDKINSTPCIYNQYLSEKFEKDIYLKLENLQITGAFKIRGNLYKLSGNTKTEFNKGIITASSGNHGLGMSLAANFYSLDAKVLVPKKTPENKIRKLKNLGAEVVIEGSTYDEAATKAREIAQKEERLYIPSFDDKEIIKGNSTIGLEIFEDVESPGLVIAPVGGGGGISGISLARNLLSEKTELIGAEAEGSASMWKSLKTGEIRSLPEVDTLADGIKVAKPGKLTYEIVKNNVEQIIKVAEEDMKTCLLELVEEAKIVPELAGCAPIAALNKINLEEFDSPIVCFISGGNIDRSLLNSILSNR